MSAEPSLFERNLAAFAAVFPNLGNELSRISETTSRVVGSAEGGDLNIDLGHTTLYEIDAASFAKSQIDAFNRDPQRFYLDPPTRVAGPVCHLQDLLSIDVWERCSTEKLRARRSEANPEGGYLLVYGIGLGLHLVDLFDQIDVLCFVIIEEHLEFLYHSLHFLDWRSIFETMRDREQEIRFYIGSDADVIADKVHWYLREPAFGMLDGSYIFRHYTSLFLDTTYRLFKEKLPLLTVSNGYYEDEYNMLCNGTANLIRYDFRLLTERPRTEKNIPAFIVGSGPSLDSAIEIISKYRDQVILFSGGTALKPLLEHGITPDFHCELENTKRPTDHLIQLHQKHGGFPGVTLIAATTVDPRMGALFEDRVFFFRDSVSTTPLWSPSKDGIYGAAPTCTNTALRMAQLFNLSEVYLLGVDLGTRDSRAHHSRHSVYHSDGGWLEEHDRDPNRQMGIEMPANFGGTAYTSIIFHWAEMMMSQTIRAFGRTRVFNCSDGIRIDAATPKLLKSVKIDTPPGRRRLYVERIKAELEPHAAHDLVPPGDVQDFYLAMDDYYCRLRDCVAIAQRDRLPLRQFYRNLRPFVSENRQSKFASVLKSVNIGTIMMFMQIGTSFDRRASMGDRDKVLAAFYEGFGKYFGWIHGETCLDLPMSLEGKRRDSHRYVEKWVVPTD